MATVTLEPITAELARAVLSGDRQADWEATYPSEGDVHVANRIAEGAWASPTPQSPWGPWLVRSEGLVVGGVGFHGMPDEHGSAEIGYGIAEGARGKGIATQAVEALLLIADEHAVRRLTAATDLDNVASQRVLQHCGFTLDGEVDGELRWSRNWR